MPISDNLPYEWFDTPNLHLCTVADFERFCGERNIRIVERKLLTHGRPVTVARRGRVRTGGGGGRCRPP